MTNYNAPIVRAGQEDIVKEHEQAYTLIIFANDRPGAIDRIVNILRRRRSNMRTMALGRAQEPETLRISAAVTDSEVGIDQLIEQIRKNADVQRAFYLTSKETVSRELALVKVSSNAATFNEIIELGQRFGAHTVNITPGTITLEIVGDAERVEAFLGQIQRYGIRDVAHSGRIAIARDDAQR